MTKLYVLREQLAPWTLLLVLLLLLGLGRASRAHDAARLLSEQSQSRLAGELRPTAGYDSLGRPRPAGRRSAALAGDGVVVFADWL